MTFAGLYQLAVRAVCASGIVMAVALACSAGGHDHTAAALIGTSLLVMLLALASAAGCVLIKLRARR